MTRRQAAHGRSAEARAQAYLVRQGLTPVTSNYRCPGGELDLVMRDAETVVFVEVRYRADGDPLTLAESIDRRKQQRLRRAASHYLQRHYGAGLPPCRFDAVLMSGELTAPAVVWVRQAFDA